MASSITMMKGEWVKLDRRGRPYRVDRRDGRKIMRTSRPKDFTPEEWKSLGHEHRKALAEEYKTAIPEGIEPEEAPKESEDDDKKKKKRKKKKDAVDKDDGKGDDEPKGPDKPPEDVAVLESLTSKQMVVGAASSGCYGQGDSVPIITIDENANWVEWEEFVQNMNPSDCVSEYRSILFVVPFVQALVCCIRSIYALCPTHEGRSPRAPW